MPYASIEAKRANDAQLYRKRRARNIDRVQSARCKREGIADGWEQRQRYALGVAKRHYPLLFMRATDDVRQVAALVAITTREIGKPLARAIQRALYQLEKEIFGT